jgi:hypothetical protein
MTMDTEHRFNRQFAHWQIRLPPMDVEHRRSGKIVQAGWAIWYRFGKDDEGEYLDYYASHRMTNDRHVRLRASGATESLPAILGMRFCSDDPVEDARLEKEYHAHNMEVNRILEEKGFGLRGDEPGAVQINRFLHLQPDDRYEIPAEQANDQSGIDAPPEWASPRGCQPALSWSLQDGRTVRLEGFYLDLTYSGLLEGRPFAEANDRIISDLRTRAADLFGEEPFLATPVAVPGARGGLWLPPFRYVARLGSDPVGRDASGSVLVVCGFSPPFNDEPVAGFLASKTREIDWVRHSRDFLH